MDLRLAVSIDAADDHAIGQSGEGLLDLCHLGRGHGAAQGRLERRVQVDLVHLKRFSQFCHLGGGAGIGLDEHRLQGEVAGVRLAQEPDALYQEMTEAATALLETRPPKPTTE